jgi:hypothetical protein
MSKQILNKSWFLAGLVPVLLILGSCSGTQTTPVPLNIDCHLAYRSSVTMGIEREETLSFSATDDSQTVAFSQLQFQAQYWAGAEQWAERALKVSVLPAESSNELAAQLYQLSKTEPLRNQFVGDHGFTGLHYIYHPTSGAELQYWCVAK